MSDIEIKPAGRLEGCDCQHYVVLGEVIDLYLMRGMFFKYIVFAYEDRECVFVGGAQDNPKQAFGGFVASYYGEGAEWSMAA